MIKADDYTACLRPRLWTTRSGFSWAPLPGCYLGMEIVWTAHSKTELILSMCVCAPSGGSHAEVCHQCWLNCSQSENWLLYNQWAFLFVKTKSWRENMCVCLIELCLMRDQPKCWLLIEVVTDVDFSSALCFPLWSSCNLLSASLQNTFTVWILFTPGFAVFSLQPHCVLPFHFFSWTQLLAASVPTSLLLFYRFSRQLKKCAKPFWCHLPTHNLCVTVIVFSLLSFPYCVCSWFSSSFNDRDCLLTVSPNYGLIYTVSSYSRDSCLVSWWQASISAWSALCWCLIPQFINCFPFDVVLHHVHVHKEFELSNADAQIHTVSLSFKATSNDSLDSHASDTSKVFYLRLGVSTSHRLILHVITQSVFLQNIKRLLHHENHMSY